MGYSNINSIITEPTSIQFATSDIIDYVYVSSALFSEYGTSSFPNELIDFTRNNTIIINLF